MWGRAAGPTMDVAASWAQEEAKTAQQRTANTRNPVSWLTIAPWTVHAALLPKYKDIHSLTPPTPKRSLTSLFFGTTTFGSNVFYMTRSTPQHAEEEKENLHAQKQFLESLPKEEGSPFVPNAAINRKVCVWRGNITSLDVDAIVNAANTSLLGGGGVDGAIHNAAGDDLYEECLTLNGGKTGQTKITRGYRLPSRFVLHTVGPVGENQPALTSCYNTCLNFIDGSAPMPHAAAPIRTVAFCGVSTGIYGYPLAAATKVALNTTRLWLEQHHDKVDLIVFCTFLEKEWDCYQSLMPYYFPPAPDAAFNDQWRADHAAPSSSAL